MFSILKNIFSAYPWPTADYRSATIDSDDANEQVADRQNRVPGFSSDALARTRIALIGAGGLGGEIGSGLVRKGAGRLDICDPDTVEPSNLNRQWFLKRDLFQPKALRLAKNISAHGFLGSQVIGHYTALDASSAEQLLSDANIVIVGTDDNPSRALASSFCRRKGIPAIFTAVSEAADYGWVFVQDAGGTPCLACVFPRIGAALGQKEPCRPSPAVLDILRTVAGLVLYTVDSLLMPRRRAWNFRSVHLVGDAPDCIDTVVQRPNCLLCGAAEK